MQNKAKKQTNKTVQVAGRIDPLWLETNGDPELLVEKLTGWIRKQAHRHHVKTPYIPLDEFIHVGTIGLLTASTKFEPERGNTFMTYSSFWIEKEMKELRRSYMSVKVPREVLDLTSIVVASIAKLEAEKMKYDISYEDIADDTGLPVEQVIHVVNAYKHGATSLDTPVQSGGGKFGDYVLAELNSNGLMDVLYGNECADIKVIMEALLEILSERERYVIINIFGLGCPEQDELYLAKQLGKTRQMVNKTKRDALAKIKAQLEELKYAYFKERNGENNNAKH